MTHRGLIIRSPVLSLQPRKLLTSASPGVVDPADEEIVLIEAAQTSNEDESAVTFGEQVGMEPIVVNHAASDDLNACVVPTPEDIERIKRDAHDAGFAEGLERGVEQGREQGLAQGVAQGFEKGLADGLAQGLEEAKRRLAEEATKLAQLAVSIGEERARLLAALEDDVVAIAYAATCKMIGQSCRDHQRVAMTVRHALNKVRDAAHARVLLHPDDFDLIQENGGAAIFAQEGGVSIEPDRTITLGGCRIIGSGGELDARFETQLAGLRETLLMVRRRRQQGEAS